MPEAIANDITIHYEEIGDSDAPTFLLISGLGSQMTGWPLEFCRKLAAKGFHVVRFDNRDIGLSQYFDEAGTPNMKEVLAELAQGNKPQSAYTLADMAADAAGLLDALNIDKAHIAGASMGGMIAQMVAINHGDKCFSMCSVMSTSGRKSLPQAAPEISALLTARPEQNDRESLARHAMRTKKIVGSPEHQANDAEMLENALADVDRAYHPQGQSRQYVAVIASGSRSYLLRNVTVPTLVLHGSIDPLVPPAAGRDTADLVPGAEYVEIDGMGHDIPLGLWDTIAEHMASHAKANQ
jgi:pimeloyl-ACP methyl ester carboxylesterase